VICIAQEQVVADLVAIFSGATIIDRREKSSFGYRAVHVVVANAGKLVELQVRTRLQRMWAEISEKYADLFGSEIKYGGGEEYIRNLLKQRSELLARYERLEADIIKLKDSDMKANMRKDLAEVKEDLLKSLEEERINLSSEESEQ
jgi:putative GTP pyrophosphokinase